MNNLSNRTLCMSIVFIRKHCHNFLCHRNCVVIGGALKEGSFAQYNNHWFHLITPRYTMSLSLIRLKDAADNLLTPIGV